MRKPKPLAVVGFPDFRPDHDYWAKVIDVRVNRKTQELHVMFQHLDHEQDGRMQEIVLALPIRPSGRTADFFRACGIDVEIDAEIVPQDVIGRRISIRFGPATDDGEPRPCSFNTQV